MAETVVQVTEVSGSSDRLVAVFCFSTEPGVKNSAKVSRGQQGSLGSARVTGVIQGHWRQQGSLGSAVVTGDRRSLWGQQGSAGVTYQRCHSLQKARIVALLC